MACICRLEGTGCGASRKAYGIIIRKESSLGRNVSKGNVLWKRNQFSRQRDLRNPFAAAEFVDDAFRVSLAEVTIEMIDETEDI